MGMTSTNPALFNRLPMDMNMASLFLMNRHLIPFSGGMPQGVPVVPPPLMSPHFVARPPFFSDPG